MTFFMYLLSRLFILFTSSLMGVGRYDIILKPILSPSSATISDDEAGANNANSSSCSTTTTTTTSLSNADVGGGAFDMTEIQSSALSGM